MEDQIKHILNEVSELNSLDNKTIGERFIKYNEEYGEFSAEVCKLIGISQKPFDKEHLKEEMADWIQNVFSISIHVSELSGINLDEVFETILIKNKKWRSMIPKYYKNKSKSI